MFRTLIVSLVTLFAIALIFILPDSWLIPVTLLLVVNYMLTGEARKYSEGWNCITTCAFVLVGIIVGAIYGFGLLLVFLNADMIRNHINMQAVIMLLKAIISIYFIWLVYKQARYSNFRKKKKYGRQ